MIWVSNKQFLYYNSKQTYVAVESLMNGGATAC